CPLVPDPASDGRGEHLRRPLRSAPADTHPALLRVPVAARPARGTGRGARARRSSPLLDRARTVPRLSRALHDPPRPLPALSSVAGSQPVRLPPERARARPLPARSVLHGQIALGMDGRVPHDGGTSQGTPA